MFGAISSELAIDKLPLTTTMKTKYTVNITQTQPT